MFGLGLPRPRTIRATGDYLPTAAPAALGTVAGWRVFGGGWLTRGRRGRANFVGFFVGNDIVTCY